VGEADGDVFDEVEVADAELVADDVMATQVALPPGGGAESTQRAPSGGSSRLSLQFPATRTPYSQRRIMLLAAQ